LYTKRRYRRITAAAAATLRILISS
jgi:hypothetical protein